MELLTNKFFLLALTFGVYVVSRIIQKRTGLLLLNPILLSITVVILFIEITGIDLAVYQEATVPIDVWLSPCVVALGVPLYRQLDDIKKQVWPIIISQLVGCVVGIISVVYIAKWFGASNEVIISLAPKSVTTPIAMQVSEMTGGIPALTVSAVVITGVFGAMFGFAVFKLFKIKTPIGMSLAIGTGSHAVGTSRCMEVSQRFGAYAGLGLSINGVLTSIIAPVLLDWIL